MIFISYIQIYASPNLIAKPEKVSFITLFKRVTNKDTTPLNIFLPTFLTIVGQEQYLMM